MIEGSASQHIKFIDFLQYNKHMGKAIISEKNRGQVSRGC